MPNNADQSQKPHAPDEAVELDEQDLEQTAGGAEQVKQYNFIEAWPSKASGPTLKIDSSE